MKFLIFAGGNGTRLWPLSRKSYPKQFQDFFSNKSLFQMTIDRLLKKFDIDDLFIVTPKEYIKIIKRQCPQIKDENILIETETRDTLACVGFASFILNDKFKDEEIAILWSDHIIKYEKTFLEAFLLASEYSRENNKIVQIDVNPTEANVNLGYVKIGNLILNTKGFNIYEFQKHIEKPDYKNAKMFIESFEYLWHTGYSVFPPGKLVELYKKYSPNTSKILEKIVLLYKEGKDFSDLYRKINKTSIDYEILEKLNPSEIVVIPADLGWSDVGNWSSLKEVLENEYKENISNTDSIFMDTSNSLIFSQNKKKIICTLGLSDIVIIDTEDALLVCSLSESHKVKNIIEEIKKEKRDDLL